MPLTPAERLRERVVMAVLFAVIGLAYGLFVLIGVLYVRHEEVDSALWGAAGIYGGALVTWLVNSKGQDQQPTPVEVVQPEGEPVPVEYADAGHADLGLFLVITGAVLVALALQALVL